MNEYIEQAVSVLHTQNQLLSHHPNATLYAHLAQFVELDGFYLESEPCLVCNNPEVPFSSIKLSSIKASRVYPLVCLFLWSWKYWTTTTYSAVLTCVFDLKR